MTITTILSITTIEILAIRHTRPGGGTQREGALHRDAC
jgi:hypothetical protein